MSIDKEDYNNQTDGGDAHQSSEHQDASKTKEVLNWKAYIKKYGLSPKQFDKLSTLGRIKTVLKDGNVYAEDSYPTGNKLIAILRQMGIFKYTKYALILSIVVLAIYIAYVLNFSGTELHRIVVEGTEKELANYLSTTNVHNEGDYFGQSPLHHAVSQGSLTKVKLLIDAGADIYKVDNFGDSPLHDAADKGYATIASYFIENGASLEEKGQFGHTPLHYAVKNHHNDIVKLLLDQKVNVNTGDDNGDTPLHEGSRTGNTIAVKLLIKHGAEIDYRGFHGGTPLHRAAHYGHLDIVKILLDSGANINAKENNGYSPLTLAEIGKHNDIEQYILSIIKPPEKDNPVTVRKTDRPKEDPQPLYQYSVPPGWAGASQSDENYYRRETGTLIGDMLRNFKAYKVNGSFTVLIYDVEYRQGRPGLSEIKRSNEINFKQGKKQGIVDRILSHKIVNFGEVTALETDWIGTTKKRNNRNIQYLVSSEIKNRNIVISAFFPENNDKIKKQLQEVLLSLKYTAGAE